MEAVIWIPVAVAAMTSVFIVIFILAGTRRTRPDLGPRPAAPATGPDGVVVPPRPGAVDGAWNAMLAGGGLIGAMGGTLNGIFGRLEVAGGVLSFTRDGASALDWQVPCTQLRVRRLNVLVAKGDVEINGPMGQVRCTVSREHVNRITHNSLKDLREHGYANELVQALLSHGATHG